MRARLVWIAAKLSRTVALTLIGEHPSLDAAQPRLTSP